MTERAVLSSMLQSPRALDVARHMLTPGDFTTGGHELLFAAACDLAERGIEVDPIVLLEEVTRRGQLERCGGAAYLADLYGATALPQNIAHYAGRVRAEAKRRKLAAIGTRLSQIAADVPDLDNAFDAAARELLSLNLLVDETDDGPVPSLSSWDEFLAEPDSVEDWVIPGLLERENVVMVLAKAGSGKSWLSRQFCLCVAAGVHPFKPHERIEPASTLLIDLENTPAMVRRQSRPLASTVARLGDWDASRAHIWRWPEGLDVRRREDAQLLERVVAQCQPKLIAIGSLWNLARRRESSWDAAAEETIDVLSRIRRRYRPAIVIEHHMPKGESKTPFGGQAWERFVEYGRVLTQRAANVWELESPFRGDRDVREWPAGLTRGGRLPWSPVWDEHELRLLVEASEVGR